ncbi:TPA: CTP synthase [Patescibacteria group bacterium]|uniref:CTP synthase n=2 Tax=Bacteria division Kazan-3B-28 TaxID=1798534 RepID=A0A0G1KU00_UNCK3|nr:MAG: CTP synthase [candidate division Kazan bacterium GW2011_GWA1_44_22]KKT86985.1 MAG: CTP synthase [candidate division Kazan bacterium GW2011_GWB1_45_10]HAR54979.1 CTP synthase [Patescibacteria group bacterium]HCR42209.1 CTP synthase [Patescibacteria group bacterium]
MIISTTKQRKFIFVTGGVLSGLGKGITAASIGNILKARGYKVFMQKLDQYINFDAGTLNPGEHGEVFVTDDGAETDLDLGHYERFTDENYSQESSIMTGRVYSEVIARERRGDYLGKTVQVIPHITDHVKSLIVGAAEKSDADILITEVGGTVGDFEGMHFLEAIRQMRTDHGPDNVMYVHVVFLPWLGVTKELKTRPAQFSAHELQGFGIQPDAVMCRSDHPVNEVALNKIALAANLPVRAVVPLENARVVYDVPLTLENYGFGQLVVQKLNLTQSEPHLNEWRNLVSKILVDKRKITVGLVAKYTTMEDTYLSVFEALKAAGWHHNVDVVIKRIDAETLELPEANVAEILSGCDGYVVPGGFGVRGIEGKIKAAQFAREQQVPYLGLCLGMQIAVIEFARHVLGWEDAHSTEFNENSLHPVIHIMEYQKQITDKGGTMRLGSYPCQIATGSKAQMAYQQTTIAERHRHRYEFNNQYRPAFQAAGMWLSGLSPNGELVEIVELTNHPWFVASQFHPEFKSRPQRPHPLFREFIAAVIRSTSLL